MALFTQEEGWNKFAQTYCKKEKEEMMGEFSVFSCKELFNHFDNSKPCIFLDVAAGPAVLTLRIVDYFHSNGWSPIAKGSEFIITDFSTNMVNIAKERLTENNPLNTLELDKVIIEQMDACDPSCISPGSVTHLGCMFGIMFFPDRAKALKNLYSLLTNDGIALFSTWKSSDYIPLITDFGKYLNVPDNQMNVDLDTSPFYICSNPIDLENELLDAGYHHISCTECHTSYRFSHCEDFFEILLTSPVLLHIYPFLTKYTTDELKHHWWSFFHSDYGRKWLVGEDCIEMKFSANIAIARKN
jgi:ubiquinone/menaquinone biosynthesis C-methylase UbiE